MFVLTGNFLTNSSYGRKFPVSFIKSFTKKMSFFIQEGLIIVLLFILMLLFNHSGCDNMASGVAVEESRSVAHFVMMPFQKELKLSAIFIRPSGLSTCI